MLSFKKGGKLKMEEENLVKSFDKSKILFFREVFLPAMGILMIIVAGGITGWFLATKKINTSFLGSEEGDIPKSVTEEKKEIGIKDEKTFRDYAVGRIEINDDREISEGTHKLLRPGGSSQTAYLTSSVLDLNQFIGKCVEVWGETFGAQRVGWLMDVGRIKILEKCPEGIQ